MVFIKIAWRNILRNRRRTLITLSAVSFGCFAVIFLWSFIDGFQRQMIDGIKGMITGDIQVYPAGAEGLYNMNRFLENPEEPRAVLSKQPDVDFFVERTIAAGIVSSVENSLTAFIVGGDPDMEKKMRRRSLIVEGHELGPEDTHGTVIGLPMAKQLQVELGDKLVIMMQDRYGQLVGEAFRIVGFFQTGSDQIDNTTAHLLLPVAQRLLSLEGQVTKFLAVLKRGASEEAVLKDLKDKLDPSIYRVSPWQEVVQMLSQLIEFQQRMIFIVIIVVLIVLATGVLNTLMMSFVERIREFGLMKALGTEDRHIGLLLTCETFLLTSIGTILGVSAGLAMAYYFGSVGIDLSRFGKTFSNFLIGTVVYPEPQLLHVMTAVTVVFGTNLVASLYPSWRASRLEPIEAMRHVG